MLPPQVIKSFYLVEGNYTFLREVDTSTTVPGVTSQTTVLLIFTAMTMYYPFSILEFLITCHGFLCSYKRGPSEDLLNKPRIFGMDLPRHISRVC
jgi:hypothetical protein